MNLLLAGARAAHFVAAVWLFGELALAALLIRGSPGSSDEAGNLLRRRLPAVARFCIVVGVLSAVAWLAALAGTMSGLPLMQAVAPSVLRQVVSGTLFGRVWMVRASLALLLLLILWPRGVDRSWRLALGTAVAAAYLSTLAWTGHAAAASGPWRPAQLAGDAAHLVAAGAWLGALPALAYLLGSVQSVEEAGLAVRRFSNLAIGAVTVLIVSGIGNSWTLVGSVPALFGTRYGALLLAKLLLFALMLSFAAANRLQLSPRLAAGSLGRPWPTSSPRWRSCGGTHCSKWGPGCSC